MIPGIPHQLQERLYELRRPAPVYDPAKGGQYVRQPAQRIPFDGAIMPMSADDLRRAAPGTYTVNSRKLYTDHYMVTGTQVQHGSAVYTVTGMTDYGALSTFRRYNLEHKG